ncbi:hypothetical protein DFQ01_13116 [Paenibacillus cellulosilyticus]|uniref:GT-D fold-like domain-containing protein n=1 Tax=Paenibacillus cellulosilyticus TaxID=375489 RepID=A0A2V2YLM7_9BACL|nr:hypothetical protein DFQ01_13116 [Paenibacillus cellulosilyticus]
MTVQLPSLLEAPSNIYWCNLSNMKYAKAGMWLAVYLGLNDVLRTIDQALTDRKPLSLVRIGDGENIVLAQQSVWTMRRVLQEPWAIKASKGLKGVTLPNIKLRNELVRSIRSASIVGLLPPGDKQIKAPNYLKRPLTNRVFRYFKLNPGVQCHSCVNREMPGSELFWRALRRRRILIITRYPGRLKSTLEKKPQKLQVTHTISFSRYSQISKTLKTVRSIRNAFDIALISCGVNAVILAPQIASLTGKVAIDFGKASDRINSVQNRHTAAQQAVHGLNAIARQPASHHRTAPAYLPPASPVSHYAHRIGQQPSRRSAQSAGRRDRYG